MSKAKSKKGNKSALVIRLMQIISPIVMVIMIVLCLVFLKKNNISITNIEALTRFLTGEPLTVALVIIVFSVVKSFSLVFPPAIIFMATGLAFKNFAVAMLVNVVSTALSIILPYYLGKFLGADAITYMKSKFKVMKRLDDFTNSNTFALVFLFRASGVIPLDPGSLIFGAMEIPFGKYFVASNLGMLILSALWTLFGAKADLTNPFSYLLTLPPLLIGVIALILMGIRQNKNKKEKKL